MVRTLPRAKLTLMGKVGIFALLQVLSWVFPVSAIANEVRLKCSGALEVEEIFVANEYVENLTGSTFKNGNLRQVSIQFVHKSGSVDYDFARISSFDESDDDSIIVVSSYRKSGGIGTESDNNRYQTFVLFDFTGSSTKTFSSIVVSILDIYSKQLTSLSSECKL